MDRSWMNLSRVSNGYRNGVQTFLNFAFQNASQENMILCPCKRCGNINWHFREVVYELLIVDGFIRGIKNGFSMESVHLVELLQQLIRLILILLTISMLDKMTWKKNQQSCHVCGKSRWMNGNTEDVNGDEGGAYLRKKPVKVMRYFPLIPRLQRLFMSSKTADMRWHNDQQTDDGLLRHPADSLAWKSFDSKFPSFASDPRNVRLGLAADGFNPFKIMSTSYSTWPVVLVSYNLPPWICMKQSSFILSMIIPGEKGPGNDIDIYLQPLIEELKQLWSGVETYEWLYNGKKFSYMGHRRWLDGNHKFRFQRTLFDGTEEYRGAPEQIVGSEILFMLKDINFSYGKMNQPPITQTRRRLSDESDDESNEEDDSNEADLWKKRSIFFELPYWEHNILRHNLDVMHIEKNRDLHPQVLPNRKYRLPPSIFSMSKKEKEVFCMVLKDIKVPDVYASNISRCVSLKDRRLYLLKSHDYHILMQDLLPVALRCCMSKNVTSCIIKLSNIMIVICGKVLDVEKLKKVQDRAALTLCNLEKIFPPFFFTIMVHLVIHLPHEAILGGPVFYRWMFLSKLKSYCRNKRYPEGSIAEGYLAEECMTFCSRYLKDVKTRLNRPNRNVGLNDHNLVETYLFQSYGEPIGKVEIAELDDISWIQAHRYVPFHHDLVEPLRKFHTKYRERMRRTQNCRVVVNSSITSYASARDSNSVEVNVEYYGLLTDIIELDYYGRWKVVLFQCDWADVNTARGIKKYQFGFTMVNFSYLIHTGQQLMDEPYVFSSQVKQVFYSKDPTDEGWYVVLRKTLRDLFDMGKMRRRRLRDLSIVQNTPNSEEGNTENSGTRRVRGHTLLSDLYNLDPVERVKVSRNTHGQPVGSEARLLVGYLGILTRNANMLPINYESWHHMPDSNKNQALANIKERFALEVSDDYIKKALGMLRYQWEDAVRFWNSKKGEDCKRVGTSSRQKQKFMHPARSRSFASIAEAEEVKSGQKVGRLQLFEITHRKKDGSPITSEAGEIMEKKAKYEAIASTDSSINLENIDNRIITEVLGPERYGRVRLQGSGVTPTQYFGSGSQQYMPSGSQAQAEVQMLRDQIAQMQANTVEQIAEVQRKYEELQQQLRAEAAEREAAAVAREAAATAREAEAAAMVAEQSKKYDDLQLQLQQMI
ncbi:hypothetical protein CXB51_010684 [Gossypium anomalum]|uniref:DUF4218 domain-containing protein n=1 Tax=Gossypium anomalum TaxID=47600 RepID=A0A8J6D4K2_9ROSI|nr:hypothetical protein CXB51_010684 [Gossypium anomalum]